jgi:hypothetical protein
MPTFYTYAPSADGHNVYSGAVEAAAQPADSLKWKPPAVAEGMEVYFDGHGWAVGPTVGSLNVDSLREAAHAANRMTFGKRLAELDQPWDSSERSTWAMQLAGAKTVAEGGTSPIIETLAASRTDGKTPAQLAQVIIEKANAHDTAKAAALAAFQVNRAKIESAKTAKDLPESLTVNDLVALSSQS